MKIQSFIFLFSLLISSISTAATIKCRITAAKPGTVFSDFIGGAVVIGLESGDMVFYRSKEDGILELPVIAETVSSFGASRKACNEGSDTVVRSDGSLRLKIFRFSNCAHRDATNPDLSGYVRADITVDFYDHTGKYREMFLTPRGTPPSAHVDFEECGID